MNITAEEKAQLLNNDFGQYNPDTDKIEYKDFNYRGAIAEIGAGQEVARLLFEARNTSNTLIKTMSAFGKGCSNAIYKKSKGYITNDRLIEMIDHDYELLLRRKLEDDETEEIRSRNQELRYFTFASTVDISVNKQGWMGVRVQINGCSLSTMVRHHAKEYRIKFEPLVNGRAGAIRIVGILGINLIYAAILHSQDPHPSADRDEQFIRELFSGFDPASIRIDSIAVDYYSSFQKQGSDPVCENDKNQATAAALEGQKLSSLLVKLSATRCAAFTRKSSPAIPAYEILKGSEYLLLANLAGAPPDGIRHLSAALKAAKKPFLEIINKTSGLNLKAANGNAKDKSEPKTRASEKDIRLGIHVPLLVAHPDKAVRAPVLFSDKIVSKVARDRREDHLKLVGEVDLEEIRGVTDQICDLGHIALVSEFTPMVEMVKYVTQRTRLRKYYTLSTDGLWNHEDVVRLKTIGIVYRVDQFVGVLLHSKSNYADRNQFELVGSLVRRLATFFIYPCSPEDVLNGKSFRGSDLRDAFSPYGIEQLEAPAHGPVTLHTLIQYLDASGGYLDMLKYLQNTKSISPLEFK